MTIALGILASNGLVIAADTQETYSGLMKVPQGKIMASVLGTQKKHLGTLVISGAGSASHIDALAQDLCDSFTRDKPAKIRDIDQDIRKRVSDFQREHIVPYATFPEYERPSVSLLVGARLGNLYRLWASEKSAVHQLYPYGAVGIGAAHANVMLERFWEQGNDIQFATRLALFVMYYVKQYVDGCGHLTQLLQVSKKGSFGNHPQITAELEGEFAQYMAQEEFTLRYVLSARCDDARDSHRILSRNLKAFRSSISLIVNNKEVETPLGVRGKPIPNWTRDPDDVESDDTPSGGAGRRLGLKK